MSWIGLVSASVNSHAMHAPVVSAHLLLSWSPVKALGGEVGVFLDYESSELHILRWCCLSSGHSRQGLPLSKPLAE